MITGFSAVGCQMSVTASQTSTAYSISVPVKLSGEYSKVQSVPGCCWAHCFTQTAPSTAMAFICFRLMPKTCSRCTVEVELYRCTIAFFAPVKASKLRLISSSRDCVNTCIDTSSGIKFSSMIFRTKSKSGCEAAGKPTSISLNPTSTNSLNRSSFCSGFIGSTRA